ncbi:MAG TPA: hypothetical protein VGS20_02190 [Candidatus Acidoferrales bacterium]|nr:hypothetical protein [Candidatus Acidoferrales bacterium]
MHTYPYYRRTMPAPQERHTWNYDRIDLQDVHLPPYPQPDGSGALPDSRPLANSLFDARAAAGVIAAVGDPAAVKIKPTSGDFEFDALLERKGYGQEQTPSTILIPTAKCLAVMAYGDYFPNSPVAANLQGMVSDAIMAASHGWCGTSGPGWEDCTPKWEGNYDMTQMFLLPLVYAYYDRLTQVAREKLINNLLAQGAIDRDNMDLTQTSGPAPPEWDTVGHCDVGPASVPIPETENHVLMIATARYLTNQLVYQRQPEPAYDNRRNGCMDQVLLLLRNKLSDDFAEYNAKPYQEESRHALLNLYSYAYDAEVKLGAGMVLDYLSAHFAVSSCDLRRMVPFRRRNEGMNVNQMYDRPGFMDVSLLESFISFTSAGGADPMPAHFALHAGNTRAYQSPDHTVWPGAPVEARPWSWAITPNFGTELVLEAVCDHRLAPSVHDLFVNDLHRRFLQRLHRHSMLNEPGQQRNCDNKEIYAGSPSYLISAGGRPAIWVIPGKFGFGYQAQNLGVAVPISFMPTSGSAYNARDIIQIMHISDRPTAENGISAADHGGTENYGVAPDFACGVGAYFGGFAGAGIPDTGDGVFFGENRPWASEPVGYYLAVHRSGDFVVLEAFDTWRHPEVSFDAFKARVQANNPNVSFASAKESVYTTFFGNRIHYVIWKNLERDDHICGSEILRIEYGDGDPSDTLADAGNDADPSLFLSGTIMRSPREAAVEIHNPSLGTKLTLDWSDPHHLIRTSETGEVQQAGAGYQVWVDFDWTGPSEGDFYRPFNTLEGALNAAKDGGVIRIMAGAKQERLTIHKRVRLTAAGGTVTLRGH